MFDFNNCRGMFIKMKSNKKFNIEVPRDIIENWFIDLKKNKVDVKKRAELIIRYRKETGLSQRGFGQRFGIPHSTVQDWERWSVLTEKEYQKMLRNGLSETDIYRQLRNNINKTPENYVDKTKIDLVIEEFHKEVKKAISLKSFSVLTTDLILKLQNDLNRLMMYADKK